MLDVRRLQALREVARTGSIAAAARELRFTPSAVSQQLAKLERETGVALLERGAQSVRLTSAGRALAEHAEAILARLELAEAELHGVAAHPLRVVAFPSVASALVPAALAELDAPVEITQADPLESVPQVVRGRVDVALVYEYDHVPLELDPGLERDLVLEEPLHVLLPGGHPAARRRSVQLPELAEESWIQSTSRSACHPFTVRICRAAGFEPKIALSFDDYRAMQSLVASGAGIALVPEMSLAPLHEGVVARPVAFRPPRRRIYAVYRPPLPPAGEGFVRAVRSAVAEE